MGNVQIECTKTDVYWVHCQICGTDGPRTEDPAEAERQRAEHHQMHADQRAAGKGLPAGSVVYCCPLPECGWMHAEDQAIGAAIAALPGDQVLDVAMRQIMAAEGALADHLQTHTPLDWVREIQRLNDELRQAEAPRFDTIGTGVGPYPVREFTSESGTYTVRYAPRYGVLIWTDRDYGPAACPVSEWLCVYCKVIFPPQDGARLSAPCPRCGSAMIPTSPALRALENMKTEIEVLRAAHRVKR